MTGLKSYLLIVLVVIMAGCQKESIPEGLFSKEEMAGLMLEMYLAEAKISISRISRDSATKLFQPYEKNVLERRGINDSTLKANYNYYLQRPTELEQIMDAVIDTLILREQRLADSKK